MAEELGKIEKPSVEEFKGGRKLYFVPLVYCGPEAPDDYVERFSNYWSQVEQYLTAHTDATFSHGICPDCVKSLYPDHAEGLLSRTESEDDTA